MTNQTTPDAQCAATNNPAGIWRCTKPAGHTGDRHTAEITGVGSLTWGYVPTLEEDAADSATALAGIPYTDTDVELVSNAMWAVAMPGSVAPPPPISRDTARAALDYLARTGRLTTQGRCGASAPTILGGPMPTCSLTAGHAGWHRADTGVEWGLRRTNTIADEQVRAGADALVRLRTQAPSLSELDADEQGPWLEDARAVLKAAGGVPLADLEITPGPHALVVTADGRAVEHPAACTVNTPTGPALICLVDELVRTELTDNTLPAGRYEVWASDEADYTGRYLRIGDRLPDEQASEPVHDHTAGHPLFAPDAVLEVRTPAPETWTGAEWNAHVTAATRNRNGVAERLVRCPTPICTTACPAREG